MNTSENLTYKIKELVNYNENKLKDKTSTDKWCSDMIQTTDAYLLKKWEISRTSDVEQVMEKAQRNILIYTIINDDEDKRDYNLARLSNIIFD